MPKKKKKVCLLSEYKINEKDKKTSKLINKIDNLEKSGHYYLTIYYLDSLILQDGTNPKFNFRFLNLILAHYDEIFKDIKNFSLGMQLDEDFQLKYEDAINDCYKYNFNYFRDCFDKYEVSLNQEQLKEITKKKKKHNSKVITEFPSLKEEYSKLIEDLENVNEIVSAQKIYDIIEELNSKIPNEKKYKLFYIYKYLDINLIESNEIFELIEKNKFFLNQFSFGFFGGLGIPIGYADNMTLKLRYLFMLIKNKINERGVETENTENGNEVQKDSPLEFVFNTFKTIFSAIKSNRFEFLKYFSLIFLYFIFEGKYNVEDRYDDESKLRISLFRILCEQFSSNNKTPDEELRILHKNLKINNTNENQIEICVSKQNICFNIQDYSINSFLINLSFEKKNIMIKNHSQKLFCRDKIYEEYYNDFIQLLIKISCSHTVVILQSLHNDFKLTKTFFSDESIRKDFFDNRLKFYPFECYGIHGLTDKYLLEVYLSSIYLDNIKGIDNELKKHFREILFIFNMALNSVNFQHESLNHYVRAYLSYFGDELERKISIDTKNENIYYPEQKLKDINYTPKYLEKFEKELEDVDLLELSKKSKLEYDKYVGKYPGIQKELNVKKNDDGDGDLEDEGFYYERQLFTREGEKKLSKFNFFQALMLIDEDSYNLDPIHFHYCFLQLKNSKNYSLIKKNFQSNLLKNILEKIDIIPQEKIRALTFTAKRGSEEGGEIYFEFDDRHGNDDMSSFAKA